MTEHPHIELVRKAWQAWSAGDLAAMRQLATRDCVLHRPGSHPLSGEHKGIDAVLDSIRQAREETGGTVRSEPQQMFLDGRGHVIAVRRVTGERRGRRRDAVGAALFTIIGDRIVSVEIFEEDLDQTNQFWA
jgi:uncharacterized protein